MFFSQPLYLWLILLLAIILFFNYYRRKKPSYLYSHVRLIKDLGKSKKSEILNVIKYTALVLLIVALARPQRMIGSSSSFFKGIDIMIVLDASNSMLADDFKPTRLEEAKKVIKEFISKRSQDKIGLIEFGSYAVVKCPLTVDYNALNSFIDDLKAGDAGTSTAIGSALALGINCLNKGKTKSKVLILLTDGENNEGSIDPVTASKIAQLYKIKIYAIGIGKEGGSTVPYYYNGRKYYMTNSNGTTYRTYLDEKTLKNLTEISEGDYFRAEDNKSLDQIFKKIDILEKTEFKRNESTEKKEDYFMFLLIGCLLLFVSVFFKEFIFKRFP